MERQVRLNSDFILFIWMMALVVLVFGACTPDSDINPRTDRAYDVTESDYRYMDDGDQHVESIHWEHSVPKLEINSSDTVSQGHVDYMEKEKEELL